MQLTSENYYSQEANREYMSVSGYKDFAGTYGKLPCEFHAMEKLNGNWEDEKTTALLVGKRNSRKSIYIDAWDANNVRVTTKDDWRARRELQLRAARECNRLLALIGIAKSSFHLKNKRVKFWTGKVLKVRGMIRSWNESDSKRYSQIAE